LREADIEMRRRLRLIQRDRLADQLDRFGMAAPVMRDDAEPMPGCGMVAVELEDAHAKGLGLIETRGEVMAMRLGDEARDEGR